jgi:hypothetical protein
MKAWCIIAILIVFTRTSFAQVSKHDIFRVKNGSDVTKVIPFADRYQFSKFQDGKVLFRNGRISNAHLNYSLVHGQVLFVDTKKDTMLFEDTDFINKVFVGDHVFYYQKGHGHIEAIEDFGGVKLGKKQFLVRMGNERYASYEQYSSTSAISSYSSFINQNGTFQTLEGSDKIILRRRSIFFLIDKNERILMATRPNLLKLYPNNKKALNEYLKGNGTSFDKEEDLKNALQFASRLNEK